MPEGPWDWGLQISADVVWASAQSLEQLGDGDCFPRAPEICVEVLSPGNTETELREKTALYFDAGAKEVWHCKDSGAMKFFLPGEDRPMKSSLICPLFPAQVELTR